MYRTGAVLNSRPIERQRELSCPTTIIVQEGRLRRIRYGKGMNSLNSPDGQYHSFPHNTLVFETLTAIVSGKCSSRAFLCRREQYKLFLRTFLHRASLRIIRGRYLEQSAGRNQPTLTGKALSTRILDRGSRDEMDYKSRSRSR